MKNKIVYIIIIFIYSLFGVINLFAQDQPKLFYDGKEFSVTETNKLKLPGRDFKSNEILIKFNRSTADKLGDDWKKATLPESLKKLNNKFSVERIEPVFKDFKRIIGQMENLSKENPSFLSEKEQHLVNRNHRASRYVKTPALDTIFKFTFSSKSRYSLQQILEAYNNDPDVEYAEPNYQVSIMATIPNDTRFSQQWGLDNTITGKDVDAPEAWDIITGGNIIIAVVDTGVDYNHRDIDNNMWINTSEASGTPGVDDDSNGFIDDIYGYDFCTYNQSRDSNPIDDYGHGTHCAGIVAAEGNNAQDIAGICWTAKIMALKSFGSDGYGYVDDSIEAIYYAVNNGADVISNSWGGDESQTLTNAVDYAVSSGVVVVGAAGNYGSDGKCYPAGCYNAISVSASDLDDKRASFSNWGWSVDLAAPGEHILSLRATGTSLGTPEDEYTTVMYGTSMACPFVSGTAALILLRNPSFTPEEVRSVLKMTSDPIDNSTKPFGQGRLNAYKAVQVTVAPPVALLNMTGYRFYDQSVHENIPVNGTAKGNHFSNYQLAFTKYPKETTWTTFHTSSSPVDNGVLDSAFDTTQPWDGYFQVRLTVNGTAGEKIESKEVILVENWHPRSPMNLDIIKPGGILEITPEFKVPISNLNVEWGIGYQTNTWYSSNITMKDGTNGVWAEWDTSGITATDFYALRYTFDTTYETRYEYVDMIYFNTQIKQGFPIRLYYDEDKIDEGYGSGSQDIIVEDINADGFKELITIETRGLYTPSQVLVYDYQGNFLWSREGYEWFPLSDIPCIGELDRDGYKEIMVQIGQDNFTGVVIFAFNHDGTDLEGNWPINTNYPETSSLLVADLNRDGADEVVCRASGRITVLSPTGNVIMQEYQPGATFGAYPERYPAVGNFDDDDDLEIVVDYGSSDVAVYNLDGTIVDGFPAATSAFTIWGSIVVGDVDANGEDDIVVTTMSEPGISGSDGVYVFDRYGQLLPGWPVLKQTAQWCEIQTPALGDFDGDEDLEICFASAHRCYLYHHNGQPATGWPGETDYYAPVYHNFSIGDINSDNIPDIVALGGHFQPIFIQANDYSSSGGVWAWNFDGTRIDLNPHPDNYCLSIPAGDGIQSAITITDLEGDGLLELVGSGTHELSYGTGLTTRTRTRLTNRNSIYVWELGTPYNEAKMEWPMFQKDAQHTGCYKMPPLPESVESIWTLFE